MDQLDYIPKQQRMAMNSISQNPGNGVSTVVNINNSGQNMESINEIVHSIRSDIKNIKEQFNNLPTAPDRKYTIQYFD